jgi:predicted phosphohydrolase
MASFRAMKIFVASDLHLEKYQDIDDYSMFLPNTFIPDILIFPGDIHFAAEIHKLIEFVKAKLPKAIVIIVAGNHEFFYSNIDCTIRDLRRQYSGENGVYFLEDQSVEIHGYTIIGATLWSDFSTKFNNTNKKNAIKYIDRNVKDFKLISKGHSNEYYTTKDAILKFEQSKTFIGSTLKKTNPEKTIVVTHFPPSLNILNMNYESSDENPISGYFTANCEDLIHEHKPLIWISAHNHWNANRKIGSTLMISNQYCYPWEENMNNTKFNRNFILNLE